MSENSGWFEATYKALHIVYVPFALGSAIFSGVVFSFFAPFIVALPAWIEIFLVSIFVFITTIVCLILVRRAILWRIHREAREKFGFPHLKLMYSESLFQIEVNNQYLYKRKIRLKATKDGQGNFMVPFGYAGNISNCNIESKSNAKMFIGPYDGSYTNWIFIEFDEPLMRKHEIEIDFEVKISDKQNFIKPFMAYTCIFPIEKYIRQTISFGEGVNLPKNPKQKEYIQIYHLNSIEKSVKIINRKFNLMETNPKIGRKYSQEWDN